MPQSKTAKACQGVNYLVRKKVKFTLEQVTKAQRGGEVYLYSFLNLGARWGVVSARPRPLYPRGRHGTHCIGDWVGPRVGLEGCENSCPTGIRSPDRPARSQLLRLVDRTILAHYLLGKNVNFTLEQATKAQRVSRGIALLFL